MNQTRRLYTLLAVGKRDLAWDESTYRTFLLSCGAQEVDGRVSAKTLNFEQLVAAVEALKRLGFKVRSRRHALPEGKRAQIAKIEALWVTLADAGVIRNRDPSAMQRWCKRVTRRERLQWSDVKGLSDCIESLKALARRHDVDVD